MTLFAKVRYVCALAHARCAPSMQQPVFCPVASEHHQLRGSGYAAVFGRPGMLYGSKRSYSFFYYILRMRGTKKDTGEGGLGVTLHGLRDGFLQKKFERLTGQPAPMMGVDVKYV